MFSSRNQRPLRSGLVAMAGIIAVLCATTGIAGTAHARPRAGTPAVSDPVISWSRVSDRVAISACLAAGREPVLQAKLAAMTQIAVHDAVNTVKSTFAGYAYVGRRSGASVPAAVASASRHVLLPTLHSLRRTLPAGCAEQGIRVVESRYADAIAQLPVGHATTDGISVGAQAAQAIIQQRWSDPTGDEHRSWRSWGRQPAFVVHDLAGLAGLAATGTAADAIALEESRQLGGDGVVTPSLRTADETNVALFWRQNPVLTWNAIARQAAGRRHLDPWRTARLLGVLDISVFDAYVAAAALNGQRPTVVSRQRAAVRGGSPATRGDRRWTPLSGADPGTAAETAASFVAGAAATALASELGSDRLMVVLCSSTVPGRACGTADPVVRRFAALSQTAAEAGRAQVLLGRQLSYDAITDLRSGAELSDVTAGPANPLTVRSIPQNCYPGSLPLSAC